MKNTAVVVPLNFRIACKFLNVEVFIVLQCFLDHLSIVQVFADQAHLAFRDSTKVMSNYIVGKYGSLSDYISMNPINKNQSDLVIAIVAIANMESFSSAERQHLVIKPIEKLKAMLGSDYSEPVEVDGKTLTPNNDFAVICELLLTYIFEYLEYFMSKISFGEVLAMESLGMENANPALDFFLKNFGEMGNLSPILQECPYMKNNIEIPDYGTKYRDLQNRTQRYESILKAHYNQL